MKLTSKVIKVGTSFYGVQVYNGEDKVWGKFVDSQNLTAEQMQNFVSAVVKKNPEADFEIEYTKKEGKTGLTITTIAEVQNGKAVAPTQEQTVAPKSEPTTPAETERVKDKGIVPGTEQKTYNKPRSQSTQDSIESQVAAKIASEITSRLLVGQVTESDLSMIKKVFDYAYDVAIARIKNG